MDDIEDYFFTATGTETYSDPFPSSGLIAVADKNLQPFDAEWGAPFWEWGADFSRFTAFGSHEWSDTFSYRYIKDAGFASFSPESSPANVWVAWRFLNEAETWYQITRGQVRVTVNPPASDTHVLLVHKFLPKPPPDPDPEDGIPARPATRRNTRCSISWWMPAKAFRHPRPSIPLIPQASGTIRMAFTSFPSCRWR